MIFLLFSAPVFYCTKKKNQKLIVCIYISKSNNDDGCGGGLKLRERWRQIKISCCVEWGEEGGINYDNDEGGRKSNIFNQCLKNDIKNYFIYISQRNVRYFFSFFLYYYKNCYIENLYDNYYYVRNKNFQFFYAFYGNQDNN